MFAFLNYIISRWFFLIPLLLVVLTTFLSFEQLISIGVKSVDDMARKDLKTRVELAIKIEKIRLKDILLEWTYWDESFIKLIQQQDEVWAFENLATYMNDDLNIPLVYVILADDRVGFSFLDGKAYQLETLMPQIQPLLLKMRNQWTKPEPVNAFIKINGMVYLIAMDTFIPEFDKNEETDGSVLGFGRLFSQAYLDEIATNYYIPGLTQLIENGNEPIVTHSNVAISSALGVFLSQLKWDEQTPAGNVKQQMLKYVYVGAAVVFFLLSWIVCLIDKRYKIHEKRLTWQAHYDALTRLLNRHRFYEQAELELKRASRNNSCVCILLMDIDHFKKINDDFGHDVGDKVLRHLADSSKQLLREFDICARYGGEEFIILLPDTNLQQAVLTAERMCRYVASSPLVLEGMEISYTLSIGVAKVLAANLDKSIILADKALYESKSSGRNRVTVFDDSGQNISQIKSKALYYS